MVLFLDTFTGTNSVIKSFNSDRIKIQTPDLQIFLLKRYINTSVLYQNTHNMEFSLKHSTVKNMLHYIYWRQERSNNPATSYFWNTTYNTVENTINLGLCILFVTIHLKNKLFFWLQDVVPDL